ncbi:MAG: glutamine synthetase beta-grasp domain-containing protein [Verrucomicrobia bacterium]|jgi:glutamine synthetase|nr:glutamine synthetase beta-grasp domain-containing protein [Verrucomicrobiota bacterium]MDA1048619.1 glutamine synthetase beta-grasp domain-containing protein [Verrucomicrobiota bacterium]
MSKHKLEYIWLDGYKPTQSLRSKTMVVDDFSGKLEDAKQWSFDGSSTEQASGDNSDCLLQPVSVFPDPDRFGGNGWLVMTEVLNADGTPHESNGRATIEEDDDDFWFGYEQEYTLIDPDTNLPLGFPENGFPGPQGPYYTSVGAANTFGRDLVDEHLHLCIEAGINIEGINAEVMMGQWEYQIFAKGAGQAGDEVWVARYLLERAAEKYGIVIDLHPKPIKGDWNGSGMHCNFSNGVMRDQGGEDVMTKICEHFGRNIDRHVSVYGAENAQRLTGLHETQAIDKFSYGVSDRGASIRIPVATIQDGWKGRLEDRRPASNGDPYRISAVVIKTTNEALAS